MPTDFCAFICTHNHMDHDTEQAGRERRQGTQLAAHGIDGRQEQPPGRTARYKYSTADAPLPCPAAPPSAPRNQTTAAHPTFHSGAGECRRGNGSLQGKRKKKGRAGTHEGRRGEAKADDSKKFWCVDSRSSTVRDNRELWTRSGASGAAVAVEVRVVHPAAHRKLFSPPAERRRGRLGGWAAASPPRTAQGHTHTQPGAADNNKIYKQQKINNLR